MKIWSVLAGGGAILLWCSWHPLKMSYTAVKYEQEKRYLEVQFRVFQDDVEAAFLQNYGYRCNIVAQADDPAMLSYLEGYFDQVFDVWSGGEEICLSYQRMQPEQQMGLVLYFKSPPLDSAQLAQVRIFNTILTTTFPQQVNMFYFGLDADRRYTTQMDVEVQEVSITF
ncbi:MAG: hypothetical protein RIC19_22745 [Phaeodactylibacter sp.]|uniref:DUF6702 family protein n=1 Tax=Phaeodactylibacter sp. TaxID=1940289 RepID=UPI0032ED642D